MKGMTVDPGLIRKLRSYFIPLPANLGCRVYIATSYSHAGGGWETPDYTNQSWDTGRTNIYPAGFWAAGTPSVFRAVKEGFYVLTMEAWFPTSIVGETVGVNIRNAVAGVTFGSQSTVAHANIPTRVSLAVVVWLDYQDTPSTQIYQVTGGAVSVTGPRGEGPAFTIQRIP